MVKPVPPKLKDQPQPVVGAASKGRAKGPPPPQVGPVLENPFSQEYYKKVEERHRLAKEVSRHYSLQGIEEEVAEVDATEAR